MRFATITGTGAFAPARVVSNAELSAQLGEEIDEFVSGVLGIRERRWCGPGESTATLAEAAAREALASAGLRPADVELLIVATDTPEHISPATASVLHGRLGARRAGTFDVNAGCASFVTALAVADRFLRADATYRHILVVSAYAMSKYLDPADKKTLTIFADGAGAVVVSAASRPGILATAFDADGRFAPDMGVFAGGTAEPITEAVLKDGGRSRLRFVRKYPAEVNEEGWPRLAREVLARIGRREAEVALWLWTQVNRSTIEKVMAALGQPMTRTHTVMDRFGYTGSACLPMALDDARRLGRLAEGDLVLLTASGAGLAMGCVALEWRPAAA
jgi:3-oxoacyl-[acyl-carrier-protein] synthase-3